MEISAQLLVGVPLFCAIASLAQAPAGLRVDVNLVAIPCVVTDRNGVAVRGLRKDDFAVIEDGVPRQVRYFWQESELPLTVGLIADCGCGQPQSLNERRDAVVRFLSHMYSPEDRAFLVSVETQQTLIADLTNSVEALREGAEGLGRKTGPILGERCAACTTALWNGVYFSARLKLRPQAGRKALLLLTDGLDRGSDHGLADAIEACQGADTMVYSIRSADIYPAPVFAKTRDPLRALANRQVRHDIASRNERILAGGKQDLERISRETGGLAFDSSSGPLAEVLDRIEDDLRDQYVLAYTAPDAHGSKSYRRIQVRVTRPGSVVRARQGYYAR